MIKILVTGASGLLGSNTIQELLSKGYQVRALVRDKSKFALEYHKHVELIIGSLSDRGVIEKAVKGCKFIIHCAAETSQSKIHYSDYYKNNVEAADILYKIAIDCGVNRIIHVSTCNVFGFGNLMNLGDEKKPIKNPFTNSLYVQSKFASQNLALTFSDKIDIIIVNPTFLIGPFDQKPSSGRIIIHGYGKRIIFYPSGGKNFVDVRDAAKAIAALLLYGRNREAYILAGENLTYKQFFRKLSNYTSNKPLLIKIPNGVLLFAGLIGNILRKLGIENEYTLTNMKILCIKNYYSNSKIQKELNIVFTPIDNAISDSINWFKSTGRIK